MKKCSLNSISLQQSVIWLTISCHVNHVLIMFTLLIILLCPVCKWVYYCPSFLSSSHEGLSLVSSTISRSVSSTPERKSAVSFELSLTGIIPILANWETVKAESYNLSLNLPCLSWQNLRLQNLPYFFGSTWLSSIWSLASLEEQFPLSSSWFWHC